MVQEERKRRAVVGEGPKHLVQDELHRYRFNAVAVILLNDIKEKLTIETHKARTKESYELVTAFYAMRLTLSLRVVGIAFWVQGPSTQSEAPNINKRYPA